MSLNRAVNRINLYSELSEVYELSARLIALTKSGFLKYWTKITVHLDGR